jgi:hypothetical protein
MSEPEEKAPAAQTTGTLDEATIIRETVTYGIDGRCSITFTEPAKPVVVEAPKLPRWRTNHLRRRSAGFIDREVIGNLLLLLIAMIWIFAS